MSTISSDELRGVSIDSDDVQEITVDGDVVWTATIDEPVSQFENGQFRETYYDGDGTRPTGWRFGDATTGDSAVSRLSVLDNTDYNFTGDAACYTQWTGNSSNTAPVWIEQDVDLTGADAIEYTIYGNVNSYRAAHRVYVDGTEVADHGTVSDNQVKTVQADVSSYSGVHTVRFTWTQVDGDNHGGTYKDDIKLL